MLRIFNSLFRLFNRAEVDPDAIREEKWVADFSHPRKARFQEVSEAAYETKFEKGAFVLHLKKGDCLAWVEEPHFRYSDLVVETTVRFAPDSPYSSAGLLFRCADENSYYLLLVSTKGYFRVDAVFNGSPMPLAGWTELPTPTIFGGRKKKKAASDDSIRLRAIALDNRLTIIINDSWAAEFVDDTLASGHVAFAAASYDKTQGMSVRFESLKIESRTIDVEAAHLRWNTLIRVEPASRLSLAETFSAMGQPASALVQLKRGWKSPPKSAPKGEVRESRGQRDLLLAADCAMRLSLSQEAEDYLDRCVELDPDSDEAHRAIAEKAKLLYLSNRYAELKDHAEEAITLFPADATFRVLLGHAYLHLGDANRAAEAYDEGALLDPENGLIAQNAAIAYERLGNPRMAFDRYYDAGRAFLARENYEDLALVLPRLLDLGSDVAAVHALAGKHAFALEDWARAASELSEAARLQAEPSKKKKNAPEDPAVSYLRALLAIRSGKRADALPLLERAVDLEGDYAPFRFRLAENRFLLHRDPHDEKLAADLSRALELAPEDGWIANLAAQIELAKGNLDEASAFLERAAAALESDPSIQANRSELAFLRGNAAGALDIIAQNSGNDEGGILATEEGNILVRLGRYEDADKSYARALRADPKDAEYLRNRASCLIELGRYGEADELLSKAFEIDPSPRTLELTAYVAAKKGEFPRAEAACRLALEIAPKDTAILSSLAWAYLAMSRWNSAEETIARLESVAPPESETAKSAAELRARLLESTTKEIVCASCDQSWRVLKDAPVAPPLRLVAEPPDDLPAGTCPHCHKTYCIGCAKASMVEGRFTCPICGERLKLLDEGLKKLLADWASAR